MALPHTFNHILLEKGTAMPNYVRVRDNTGAKFSVVDTAVEDYMTVLKSEPATDANGDPLRDEPAEDKPAAKAASKENS